MRKIVLEKVIALVLILAAGGATYYFYQQDEISFLPQEERQQMTEVPISESQYRLSYNDKTEASFDITNFENNKSWFGDGNFDFSTYFEGEASLFLSSFNHQKASVRLKKNFDIKDVLNFKFLVYLATDPVYIEELDLILVGANSEYKFPIREINKGWNLLILPKEGFSKVSVEGKGGEEIEEVMVELFSRPKRRSSVNLDSLWAEKEKDYLKDWNFNSEKFLALKRNKDTTSLLAINLADNRATLRKGSGKDYSFQAKFTPTKEGGFGFFLRGDYKSGYGYYLVMNGTKTNGWQIYKYGLFEEKTQTVNLAKGEISSFNLERNQAYWLKADLKGRRIVFNFSQDGKNFTKLGEVDDNSFGSGGIGVTVGGGNMVFIDDLQFLQ